MAVEPGKRRILRKLQITEISSVDNPCQEHARMTIMKRAPIERVQTRVQRMANLQAKTTLLKASIFGALDAVAGLAGGGGKKGNPYHDDKGRFSSGDATHTARTAFSLATRGTLTPRYSAAEAHQRSRLESEHADRNRFVPPPTAPRSVADTADRVATNLVLPIATWLASVYVSRAITRATVTGPAERAIIRGGLKRLMAAPNPEAARTEIDALRSKLESQGKPTPIRTLIRVISALRKARQKEIAKAATDPILSQLGMLLALLNATTANSKMQKVADKIAILKLNAGVITKFNQNHDNKGRFTARGSSTSPTEPKGGKLKRVGRKVAAIAAGAVALGAAAFFASPHVFAILDKINAGSDLTPRQMAGIVKYAESDKRQFADGLVQRLKKAHDVSGKEAQDKVLKAVEDLIALRERQNKAGAEHVPPAAAGLRSTGFNIPLKVEKAVPKDELLVGLRELLQAVKQVKV